MSEIKSHRDLLVWQKAVELALHLYEITKNFPPEERFGLTSQMRRAAVSIPSNIAEGAARDSHKEFIRSLYTALGSLAELETQLLLSKELGFVESSKMDEDIERIRKMLFAGSGIWLACKNNRPGA